MTAATPKHRIRALTDAGRATLEGLPLRVRLVATTMALLVIAMIISSLVTAALTQRDLLARVDAELRSVAAPVANQALSDLQNPENGRTPTNYAFVLMTADGQPRMVLLPTGVNETPALPPLAVDARSVTTHEPFTVGSTDGHLSWRFVAGAFDNGAATFAVGVPITSLERTLTRLVATNFLISAIVLALCAIIGWYAVNRAFRPLRRIEDTASAIAAGDLTQRIPVGHTDDEVASLSESLNVMLGRIQTSFEVREASESAMRQFVADASHELRTPLATVRGYAELYRQGAVREDHDVAAAMGRIESEAHRMSGLVEDLLLLARMDKGVEPVVSQVDLTVLAADAVEDARVRTTGRPIRLTGLHGHLAPTEIMGADAPLRQVVTNLVANAIDHTPPESPIEVRVGMEDHLAMLVVEDHGPGIAPAERPRVFERFYRADASRGRSGGGGNGLGLAIVAAIVDAHGGRVGVTETPGGGATFVVRLPTAGSQATPRTS
ncbi:MAG: HAMP domain-containing histidine kinase [Dermatophilaceae bacterium]|nr:HAMP domain-containing histidine kinase [Dermatophilaceae bacterium]